MRATLIYLRCLDSWPRLAYRDAPMRPLQASSLYVWKHCGPKWCLPFLSCAIAEVCVRFSFTPSEHLPCLGRVRQPSYIETLRARTFAIRYFYTVLRGPRGRNITSAHIYDIYMNAEKRCAPALHFVLRRVSCAAWHVAGESARGAV